ncbi:SDR family NAD(P)-dependent oxidoreductase [Kitasatospora sp. NPDC004289]
MDLGLAGKVALVAAGTSGLGLAVATAFAREGATVSVAGRDPERLARAVAALEKESAGGSVSGFPLDVRDEEAVADWVARAAELHGGVDIVVTNAGGPGPGHATEHSVQTYRDAVELNLLSAVSLVSAAVPHMRRAGWGRVLFITSLAAKQPISGMALSNTVRPGLLGYAKSLVHELSPDGITVNVLAPGMTRTPELEHWAKGLSGGIPGLTADIPAGRLAEPEELGAAAAFLASTRAAFVTGTVLPVDGGATRSLL